MRKITLAFIQFPRANDEDEINGCSGVMTPVEQVDKRE